MKVRDCFLFVTSMILLAVCFYFAISRFLFLARAQRAVGVVRELSAENGRCGGARNRYNCTKFYAAVELQSAGGRRSSRIDAGYTKHYGQPVSRALYQPGDRIPVFFDPNHPEEICRDKFWDLWGRSLSFFLFTVFIFWGSVRNPEMSELVTLKLNEGN